MADRDHEYRGGIDTGRLRKEDNSYFNVADMFDMVTTEFGSFATDSPDVLLSLNANLPLSDFRDVRTVQNGATIEKVESEYRIRTSTQIDSVGELKTAYKGQYVVGNLLKPSVGLRIPNPILGNGVIEFGYFQQGGDGVYFEYNVNGIGTVVETGGVEYKTFQADWNHDTLDGSGDAKTNPSGAKLDMADGILTKMAIIYYGYGPISFYMGMYDKSNRFRILKVHEQKFEGRISIDDPNLPLSVRVDNNDSEEVIEAYVGGRRIEVVGDTASINSRTVGEERTITNVGPTTILPLISFKLKSEPYDNVLALLESITIEASADISLYFYRNATLTGANFVNPTDYDPNEVATLWDKSATAIADGFRFGPVKTIAGGNNISAPVIQLPELTLPIDDVWTIATKARAQNNVTVITAVNAKELW